MSNMDKVAQAANDLENLASDMKQAVIDLRSDGLIDSAYAYWRVYDLRRRLGQVVAELGAGVPIRDYGAKKSDSGNEKITPGKPKQFEMNHWVIHQANSGECVACDKVTAWKAKLCSISTYYQRKTENFTREYLIY